MPGKQMAIDADLNAGLIGEARSAPQRRSEIAQEAEFYGSMDGASKFVRGDAVAGIIIMLINIIGGLTVGTLQHDLSLAQAAQNYTLLTIGDGLVAQIPALIISTAAGILVTRVSTEQDMNQLLVEQLGNRPQRCMWSPVLSAVLALIPGMPHCGLCPDRSAGGRHCLLARAQGDPVAGRSAADGGAAGGAAEVSWSDVVPIDALGLEVGYRLITLVDRAQDGELLRRIRGLRKKFAADTGFLVPAVHIRDNLELRPNAYRIALKGVEVGTGEVYPGMYLAINPGRVLGPLQGTTTRDPAFGLPATWVDAAQRENAQALGYTVVDASTVVATHLSSVIQAHAAELLGREETQALLDHVARDAPKLVEDVVPKVVPLAILQKVLQNLLNEGVHIRDMRSVLETLAEHGPRSQDPDELTSAVRVALSRAILQTVFGNARDLEVYTLDPQLEQMLTQASQTRGAEGPGLEPGLAERLLRQAGQVAQQREQLGQPAVLLVPAPLRNLLSRFLRRAAPQLKVLSQSEVPDDRTIRVVGTLGGAGFAGARA